MNKPNHSTTMNHQNHEIKEYEVYIYTPRKGKPAVHKVKSPTAWNAANKALGRHKDKWCAVQVMLDGVPMHRREQHHSKNKTQR